MTATSQKLQVRPQVEGGEALHGLRGIACIIVVLYHSLLLESDAIEYGYGFEHNKHILQLPFIRVIFAGRAMTKVFFVLSGYVLSFDALKRSAHGLWSDVQEKMASAMLRRGIRLFMPPLVTTFITMLLFSAGAFDAASNPAFATIRRQHSLILQFRDWITESGRMMNIFRWQTVPTPYNPHLWTIAHEYRGSILLFGTLAGCSKVKLRFRLATFIVILLNAIMDHRLEIALFFCGAILAELVLLPEYYTTRMSVFTRPYLLWLYPTSLLAGMFLIGFPALEGPQTPGYRWLATMVPFSIDEAEWWHSIGSVILVGLIVVSPNLQRPLLAPPGQWLGDISFAIYLIHNPIIRLLIPFWVEVLEDIGLTAILQNGIVYLLLSGFTWPVLLTLSWLVSECVDKPSMTLARFIEDQINSVDVLPKREPLVTVAKSA